MEDSEQGDMTCMEREPLDADRMNSPLVQDGVSD